jgi:hypothetical protein
VEAGSYQPPMYSGQTRVAVTGSPVTGVEVVVVPPIRLEGVLEIETHDDKPYPRAAHGPLAALNLMSSGSQRPMPGSQAKFDEDNRFFAFEGAPPGLWDLVVSPIGTGCVKSIQFRGRDVPLTGRLDLTAGGGDLKVVLTTRCASIKGQIEGAASGNVQPAVLMVFDGGDTRLRSNLTGGLPDAFHITGLSSGTYRIYALARQNPEIAENPELLRRLNEHSTRVTLSEGEQARVTLRLIPEDVIERAFEGP